MKAVRTTLFFCVAWLLFTTLSAQQRLPRSTPAAEGVSAEGIAALIQAFNASPHEMHSFMLLRHGKVVAETWWSPFEAELRHTLYSCSKSFTSTAVGFAVQEGLLSLDDKVVDHFTAELPQPVPAYLQQLTLRHLLTMSVGMRPDPSFDIAVADSNWIKAFLRTPILEEPGSVFLYNSAATYMAGVMVQRASGQRLLDYLTPRLFDPLGITGADWEQDLLGYDVGGWGLRLKTEDMAKFAQLYLQKGRWNGRQILPEQWVDQATSAQIIQNLGMDEAQRSQSDWNQGYGFQFWRSRHRSFRGDGAYGQFMLVLPEYDAVVAITSETNDLQGQLNLVWEHLLPAFNGAAPKPKKADKLLKKSLKLQQLAFLNGEALSTAQHWQQATIALEPNDKGWQKLELTTSESHLLTLTIHASDAVYAYSFAHNGWSHSTTERPGPYLRSNIKGYFDGLAPAMVCGQYAWTTPNQLQLELRYIESPHAELITLDFQNQAVEIGVGESQHFGQNIKRLKGVLAK